MALASRCAGKKNSPCGCAATPSESRSKEEDYYVPPSAYKRAPNAQDQFASYHDDDDDDFGRQRSNIQQEDPWTYSGKRLQALQFPLGGFGTS
jgi:hypothetical protein